MVDACWSEGEQESRSGGSESGSVLGDGSRVVPVRPVVPAGAAASQAP